MADRRQIPYPLALAVVVALCVALFWLGWRYDNKYTYPRYDAQMGHTWLDETRYEADPFLYLVDGWEFYAGELLSPAELASGEHTPDAYFYLGRYGGFDLGDPSAPRHGKGTYRMTVVTGTNEGPFALELTELYSRWNLWVNGKLAQSVGMGEAAPAPENWMAVFPAENGRVEIVVAVEDDGGLYSGMVYPPAFGSPQQVGQMLTARLLIHCAVGAAALLIGVLCLLAGLGLKNSRPYLELFALCLCFCVYTAYPLFQALGVHGGALPVLERFCYYATFVLILWIQGRLCGLPKKLYYTVCGVGAAVCASVFLQPLFPAGTAAGLQAYGIFLAAYKWLSAGVLLGAGIWAARRSRAGSRALLAGACVFACALIIDRLYPLYEPILTGWPVELAGFVLILIIAGILWRDTVQTYRNNLLLKERKKRADLELKTRREYAALQQDYVRRTERMLHENRNNLVAIRHYGETRDYAALSAYVDSLLGGGQDSGEYTENALLNAILGLQFARAKEAGVYVEYEIAVPPELKGLDGGDLTGLLMNLLDNALDACEAVTRREDRWMYLHIRVENGILRIACGNSANPSAPQKGRGHGYGLSVIREIAGRYHGGVTLDDAGESFEAKVWLDLTGGKDG